MFGQTTSLVLDRISHEIFNGYERRSCPKISCSVITVSPLPRELSLARASAVPAQSAAAGVCTDCNDSKQQVTTAFIIIKQH